MSITSHVNFFRGEDVTLNFQMTPVQDITGWSITWKLANMLGGTILLTKSATIVDGPRPVQCDHCQCGYFRPRRGPICVGCPAHRFR